MITAQQRTLVRGHRADRHAQEAVGAGGRRVEAAEDVHAGRLARAARAHDRDELPPARSRDRCRAARAPRLRPRRTFVTCDSSITWRGGVGMPVISWRFFVDDDFTPGSTLRSSACLEFRHWPSDRPCPPPGARAAREYLRHATVGRARLEDRHGGLAVFEHPDAAHVRPPRC